MSTIATPRSSAGLVRWAVLGGVAYVVCFVVGVILIFNGAPDSSSAPGKIIAYYGKSGHRDRINIGWVVTGLGVFFFLWFLSALRRSVRLLEGDDGFLTGLTTVGGAIYASLTLAAIAVDTGIRTMSDDTYHHTVYPGLIHAADDAGWVLHASGGVGLGAMIIAASLAALRAGGPGLGRMARDRGGHPLARADRVLPVVPRGDLDPGRQRGDVPPRRARATSGGLGNAL